MTNCQSDQKLSSNLNQVLTPLVDKKQKCISNSLSVSLASGGSFILYFTRGNDHRLYIVVISIGVDEAKRSVRVVPVNVKNTYALETMQLQISQCRLMQEAFAVLAYDDRNPSKDKLVYVMSISLQKVNDKSEVELVNVVGRQQGKVKDIKWHQDSLLSLLVLTETKLLVYKLDQSIYEPVSQIVLKDLTVASSTEVIKRNYFEKIAFVQKINEKDNYSSLGKKLSLYLIANNAAIYLLFPFINSQIIIDEEENNRFKELKARPSVSSRKEDRALKMMELFKNSKVQQIKENSEERISTSKIENNYNNEEREYSLGTPLQFSPKVELFKLSPVSYSKTTSYPTITTIESFRVLTLCKHTTFLTVTRSKTNYHIKLQVFSEQPYQKLLASSNYAHSQNFAIEIVSQVEIDARDFAQNLNGMRVLSCSTMRNDLFIMINALTCYRFCLDGLVNLLTDKQNGPQSSKLVECDILFQSKTPVMTVCNNHSSIYLIRHFAESYFFQSIPFQSIDLKQRIRQTIQQTENLFKKLVPTSPSYQKKEKNIPLPAFSELKESTLVDIEKKLSTFSTDCRKSIEFRLQKIKRLYEGINVKKSSLQRQQGERNKLIELINRAEDNDKRIKQIIVDDKDSYNRNEKDLRRRVMGIQKTLADIKNVCEKEMQTVEQDQDKLETIQECQDQAEAVINQLQEVKLKLVQKKKQLKSRLRYA